MGDSEFENAASSLAQDQVIELACVVVTDIGDISTILWISLNFMRPLRRLLGVTKPSFVEARNPMFNWAAGSLLEPE